MIHIMSHLLLNSSTEQFFSDVLSLVIVPNERQLALHIVRVGGLFRRWDNSFPCTLGILVGDQFVAVSKTLPYLIKQSDHLHAFWLPLPAGSKYHQPPSRCHSSACTNTQPIWSARSHDRLTHSLTGFLHTKMFYVLHVTRCGRLSLSFTMQLVGESNLHTCCLCSGLAHFIDSLHTSTKGF